MISMFKGRFHARIIAEKNIVAKIRHFVNPVLQL